MDLTDFKAVRFLVVLWTCAPFGPLRFFVWLWYYVTLGWHVQKLARAYPNPMEAGYHLAPRFLVVFGKARIIENLKARTKRIPGGLVGDPVDLGMVMYVVNHDLLEPNDGLRE